MTQEEWEEFKEELKKPWRWEYQKKLLLIYGGAALTGMIICVIVSGVMAWWQR